MSCLYYTNETLNDMTINFKGVSIIHFNARSLNRNFTGIKELLSELHCNFDVIAITETWLDPKSIEHCKLMDIRYSIS